MEKETTECKCGIYSNSDDAVTDLWLSSNSVLMGAFTVVGYLFYRFSQTLPPLIRWPIRLFCTLTGLSALWGWVSRLVGTIRVFQILFTWLSRIWRFIVALFSKFRWLLSLIKAIAGFLIRVKQHLDSVFTHKRTESSRNRPSEPETHQTSSSNWSQNPDASYPSRPRERGLRLILLGPTGGGRTSLANTLLGCHVDQTKVPTGALMESTEQNRMVDGREVTVIDTPDLFGESLGDSKRALEALRSIQLASPGPHAFLLVIRAPGSSLRVDQDVSQAVRATMDLFGDEVTGYIIPVLTHADRLGPRHTPGHLLDVDARSLITALSLCGQRPERVGNGPDCPPEVQTMMRRQLLGRVMEMKALRGHFVHELQSREDRIREELLTDMASALNRKLGHM
ncbi:hypothetical protein LDENG_00167730 [Lucifuga dentata]|nr:hypothetical protein LDENG_00167730 [Lucifuga dentata]